MTRIELLFEMAKEFYAKSDDPAHDLAHVRRVMISAERLARDECADPEFVLAGALLHDIVSLPKDHPERAQASAMAAERARVMLESTGFSAQEIEKISAVIVEHSYSLGRKPSSKESAVVQDADRLDALGAIGVMRAVSCGCRMGSAYYSEFEPIPSGRERKLRELDDKKFTVDHFFTKLFKLPELMNSESARKEARRRVEFMREFLRELESEISVGDS